MANLQIEEFSTMGRNGVPVPQYPPLAIQAVAIGAGSTQSSAINAATRFVRLTAFAACYFKVGTNPTAVADATSTSLASGTIADIGVQAGHKIAVIQA